MAADSRTGIFAGLLVLFWAGEPALADPVQMALKEQPPRFNHGRDAGNTALSAQRAVAYATLVYAAVAQTRRELDPEVLLRTRDLLQGGAEPTCTGSLNSRGYAPVILSFLLIRKTPRLWDPLSPKMQKRMNLVMLGCMASAAILYADSSDFKTGLDGKGGFGKTWNMNHREGGIASLIAGSLYFGPKEARRGLRSFNAKDFAKRSKQAGLKNLARTFRKESDTDLSFEEMNGAARGFRYRSVPIDRPNAIFAKLVDLDYPHQVACGGQGKMKSGRVCRAGVVKGCQKLPNKGKKGMAQEFQSRDAQGYRSSIGYVAQGIQNSILLVGTVLYLEWMGMISLRASVRQRLDLVRVGVEDFFYKLRMGYRSCSRKEFETVTRERAHPKLRYIKFFWGEIQKRLVTP